MFRGAWYMDKYSKSDTALLESIYSVSPNVINKCLLLFTL